VRHIEHRTLHYSHLVDLDNYIEVVRIEDMAAADLHIKVVVDSLVVGNTVVDNMVALRQVQKCLPAVGRIVLELKKYTFETSAERDFGHCLLLAPSHRQDLAALVVEMPLFSFFPFPFSLVFCQWDLQISSHSLTQNVKLDRRNAFLNLF
jgi:hypothetical protein